MLGNLAEILAPGPFPKVGALFGGALGQPRETSDDRAAAEALGQILALLLAPKPPVLSLGHTSPGDLIPELPRSADQAVLGPDAQSVMGVARHLAAGGSPQLWPVFGESISPRNGDSADTNQETTESRSAPAMGYGFAALGGDFVAGMAEEVFSRPIVAALPAEPAPPPPAAPKTSRLQPAPLLGNHQQGPDRIARMLGETATEAAMASPIRTMPSITASAASSRWVPPSQAQASLAPLAPMDLESRLSAKPQEIPVQPEAAIAEGKLLEVRASGPQEPKAGPQAKDPSMNGRPSEAQPPGLQGSNVGPRATASALPKSAMTTVSATDDNAAPTTPRVVAPQEATVEAMPMLPKAEAPQKTEVKAMPMLPKAEAPQMTEVKAMPMPPEAEVLQETEVKAMPMPPEARAPQKTEVKAMPGPPKAEAPQMTEDKAPPVPPKLVASQEAQSDEAMRWSQAPRHPRQADAEGIALPLTAKPLVADALIQEAPVKATPVFSREVVMQVVSALHMASLRQGEWSIRLRSQSLGDIEVKAAVDADGFLSVALLTQSHQVEEMMQTHLPQLHQALADSGFDPGRLTLHVGSRVATSDLGFNFSGQHHPAQGFTRPFIRDGMALSATGTEPRLALWYGDWQRTHLIDCRA